MPPDVKSWARQMTLTGVAGSVRPAAFRYAITSAPPEIVDSHDDRLSRRGNCAGVATPIDIGSSWLPKAFPVARVLRETRGSHCEPASCEPSLHESLWHFL